VKEQDEDVETDEELLLKNSRDMLEELKCSIDEFVGKSANQKSSKRLKNRKEMIHNYLNIEILAGSIATQDLQN
jgi:hypothetical protein